MALALFVACAYALHAIHAHNRTYRATDLTLPDGTPARVVLPGPGGQRYRLALPDGMAPVPLVVLTHGVIGNKEMLSTLAHALADHGVAVLTYDSLGHGANPNPLVRSLQRTQAEGVIAYARTELQHVIDPAHVAMMGHSMGGGITLEYASYHDDLDAAVPIAAGWLGTGPVSPRNVLFVYAAHDLPGLGENVRRSVSTLSGEPDPVLDTTYGTIADGTGRRMVEIPGMDHITVMYAPTTARAIVDWLQQIWPMEEDQPIGDPRLKWFGFMWVVALGLTCVLTRVLVPWLPVLDTQPHGSWPTHLAALSGAYLVALLALIGNPAFAFLGVWGGDYLTGFFMVAALVLLVYTAATGTADWKLFWPDWRITLGGAAALVLVAYVFLGGAGTNSAIRMTLPPHRLSLFAWIAIPQCLFCMMLDAVTKKGSLRRAALMSFGSIVLLGVVFGIGMARGLTPTVVMLVFPPMMLLLLIFEVPSLAIYHYTRNYFLSGVYRGLLLSVFSAALFPMQ